MEIYSYVNAFISVLIKSIFLCVCLALNCVVRLVRIFYVSSESPSKIICVFVGLMKIFQGMSTSE
jgi:hypothetical protein